MKKTGLILGLFAILAVSVISSTDIPRGYAVQPSPMGSPEIRALWMVPRLIFDADPEKGKIQIREYVQKMANAHFNTLLVEMPSDYIAALTDERYQKAIPITKWDALGELINFAHEVGLQVHLWYSFTDYKSPRSPEFNPLHNGNPKWAAVQIKERMEPNKERPKRMSVLCPLNPDARRWELGLLEQVIKRYP
ncbi:MAG TPA: family 10 glycosylhydrolase, partial [Thermodesulfobacteriota bacterium]|nr:family 10 glycosylhydrolase [Thermodesulfobacteriota bacterium]